MAVGGGVGPKGTRGWSSLYKQFSVKDKLANRCRLPLWLHQAQSSQTATRLIHPGLRAGLHLYNAFLQSFLQCASHSPAHTPMAVSYRQELFGFSVLPKDTWHVLTGGAGDRAATSLISSYITIFRTWNKGVMCAPPSPPFILRTRTEDAPLVIVTFISPTSPRF